MLPLYARFPSFITKSHSTFHAYIIKRDPDLRALYLHLTGRSSIPDDALLAIKAADSAVEAH